MSSLYDQRFEHDACGIGAVIDIDGKKSHKVVDDALSIVEKLEHRAGKDASGEIGDGVGIMVQISHKFFKKVSKELRIDIGSERDYGIGMFFFPKDSKEQRKAMRLFEVICQKEGVEFLAWREVPVNEECLSSKALDSKPSIYQCFVKRRGDIEKGLDFDRKLYIIRRVFEQSSEGTYVCSFSSRTLVYKGMFLVAQLRNFYKDLQSEEYVSAIAMVHSRFS
ncbi:MAG: glutamate synthase subunit alpha, partial [Lachnospiraceae bacterium]|nr:glutamate synthase subunit alpha [Lachnospiraceae bacterium]